MQAEADIFKKESERKARDQIMQKIIDFKVLIGNQAQYITVNASKIEK